MRTFCVFVLSVSVAAVASASWYWPFGDDDEREPPRLSELMAPASELIGEATDLATDGKISEAIQKYREALETLERIEAENPDRAKTPEFATLRNKRAYVNATIDSMILNQVRSNAKVIAVSDTRELEKRLADEKAGVKTPNGDSPVAATNAVATATNAVATVAKDVAEESKGTSEASKDVVAEAEDAKSVKPSVPLTRREQAMRDIVNGDYAAADLVLKEMLKERPNNATALNLKAVMEARQGDFKAAERTLDQAIGSNPRDYHAYYNMALVMLQNPEGSKDGARRYYETGRAFGGPEDPVLEKEFK